jgi:hypothetical protein
LETVRPIWQESFREVVVNGALIARGEIVILRPEVVIYQNRRDLDFISALRERFNWGRSYAASRSTLLSQAGRLIYSILSLGLPIGATAALRASSSKRSSRGKKDFDIRCCSTGDQQIWWPRAQECSAPRRSSP